MPCYRSLELLYLLCFDSQSSLEIIKNWEMLFQTFHVMGKKPHNYSKSQKYVADIAIIKGDFELIIIVSVLMCI